MLSRSVARTLRPVSRRPGTAVRCLSTTVATTTTQLPRVVPRTVPSLSASVRPRLSPVTTSLLPRPRFLSDETRQAIDRAVHSAPVVLFMKGTPELPQCGFSRATIQILGLQGVDPEKFSAFNVLEDAELRSGIKEYSDWPTIPQLYVDHEFVGGCDILIAMHQSGELAKLFEEKGVLIAPEKKEAEQE